MAYRIYALFEYYGDGMMVQQNYLCIKYGTPREILDWLLNDGYLSQILYFGQMMGAPGDRKYLEKIKKLQQLSGVTVDTIRKVDLRMPSCCTCRAICESVKEMSSFANTTRELVFRPDIGRVMDFTELFDFLDQMDDAATSEEKYVAFANILPERYI